MPALKEDALLLAALGVGAYFLIKTTIPAVGDAAVAAAQTAAAVAQNAVAGSGAFVFDALHYTSPTADMINACPDAVAADYDGNVYNAHGDLVGYETSDYWIRDAGGRRLWQSSWSGTRYGLVFHLSPPVTGS